MKHFRIFSHTSAYTEYMASEGAIVPNIAYCLNDNQTYITADINTDIYQWVQVPLSENYDCDMVNHVKYYVEKQQVSHDSGSTWEDTGLERRGAAAETESSDCGYVEPQYRWVELDPTTDWMCNNNSKYAKEEKQVSYDGGTTWENVIPAVYQQGELIELRSVDCGYEPSTLYIEGASSVSAETCQYRAIGNDVIDVTSSATWSITAGSQYATINSSNGQVTILNGANESTVTIQAVYNGLTATTNVTLTYISGSTSETTSDITTDASGNTTTVITTVTTNEDGSSSEIVEAVKTDENGDVIGTTQGTKDTNADGSFVGTTTNYDANGDPVDGSNVSGDTSNNVSTQTVEYDESGNTVVTGYEIDTTDNPTGTKSFSGDGANTEYYAFDVTHGFELNIHFTFNFSSQPPGQHENHHNILTAKRATPSPWYGFQIRHTGTNKYIQLGTQFSGGSNVNTTINYKLSTGTTAEYDLTITYNPTASSNRFVCYDNIAHSNLYTSNNKFPDIAELKYLKVVIGYAMDENGDPYRYSNINVLNFNLRRI